MTDEETRARTLQICTDFQTYITQKRMQDWIDLWHDDGVLEFPFAPDGRAQAYHGKAAVLAQMTTAMSRVLIESVQYFKVHPMLRPECVMIEAGTNARFLTTDRPYNQTYVLYVETREGKIWRYREYWNAWTLMDAWGSREKLNSEWGQPDHEPRVRPFLTQ